MSSDLAAERQANCSVWARLVPPMGDRHLALFYRQLATMLDAGLALDRSLQVAGRAVGSPRAEAMIRRMEQGVQAGEPLCEQFARFSHSFPFWHIHMARAGEQAGKLPDVLRDLSESSDARVRERRVLVSELLLPAVTLHALFLLMPVPDLFLGKIGLGGYLVQAFKWLVLLYGLILGAYVVARLGIWPGLRHRAFVLLHSVPVIGSAVRKLAIARFATALRSLYQAGVRLDQVLPTAGRASGNDVLQKAADEAALHIGQGYTLHDSMTKSGCFPPQTLALIRTGEEAGRLDDMLARVQRTHSEEAQHTIRILSRIFALAVYLLVALLVAVRVISFYMQMWSSWQEFL